MISKKIEVCGAHTSIFFGCCMKCVSHYINYTEQMFFSQTKKNERESYLFFQAWQSSAANRFYFSNFSLD
jgi:hypothetical protein